MTKNILDPDGDLSQLVIATLADGDLSVSDVFSWISYIFCVWQSHHGDYFERAKEPDSTATSQVLSHDDSSGA